jgi:glutaredoxin 2
MIYPCFLSRQVPSLEHNNQVKGESLDLVKYIDSNFEGPSLLPEVRIHQIAINVALAK